jgi:hypothetical protein
VKIRASRCCASRRAGFPEWRARSRDVPSIRPTVARNGERSAGKAAESFGCSAEIFLLIGWQPPECNQRVDRVALDFEHEADFALRAGAGVTRTSIARSMSLISVPVNASLSPRSGAGSQPRPTRSAVTFGLSSRLTIASPWRRRSRVRRMRTAAGDGAVISDPT